MTSGGAAINDEGDDVNDAETDPDVTVKLPMPLGYRMIGSGDYVPVFNPQGGLWLNLHKDGSVTWGSGQPS